MDTLIEVKNLTLKFNTDEGLITAVEDVSFSLNRGEVMGLVGESGSGKSLTALSIMQLLNLNSKFAVSGNVRLGSIDLINTKSREIERIRGKKIGIIFQEPMSSLNPTMRCGDQIKEVLHKHEMLDKQSINDDDLMMM